MALSSGASPDGNTLPGHPLKTGFGCGADAAERPVMEPKWPKFFKNP
ncbi:MAG: hypothetical protein V4517_13770 [Pseudomonadota bacterium]